MLDGEAEILVACPVDGDLVKLLQCCDEIVDVFASCVLDSEVINNQREGDGTRYVTKQARGVRTCNKT